MAARAIWKGVIVFDELTVPVKLYSAVADRNVHFRLLHRKDKAPVRQALVNPETDEVVTYAEARRAYRSERGDLVILTPEDLEALEPEKSRDIEVTRFVPPGVIDHRWYDRPYYLGPDEKGGAAYAALAAAMERSGREGLAHWTMRNKEYIGALRLHQGYPMLITLRHSGEVVASDTLEPLGGESLSRKDLDMAGQLIEMLAADFDPSEYQDEYRERVMALIDRKRRGEGPEKVTPIRRKKPSDDLSKALQASLDRGRKHA